MRNNHFILVSDRDFLMRRYRVVARDHNVANKICKMNSIKTQNGIYIFDYYPAQAVLYLG